MTEFGLQWSVKIIKPFTTSTYIVWDLWELLFWPPPEDDRILKFYQGQAWKVWFEGHFSALAK